MLTPTHSDLLYEAAHIANAEEIPRHPPHYRTWILSLLRGLILSDIEQGRFSEDTVTAARAFLRIIATEIFEQSRRNGISTPPDGVQGYLSTSTANPTISGTSANLEGSLQRQGSTPESGSSMPTRRATLFNEPDVSNYSSEHLNTLINLFNSIVLMELGTDIPEFHFVFAVREALTQLGRYRLRLNESEPGQDLARNVLALDPVDPNEMDPQAPEMEPSQLDGTSDNLNIGSESQPEDGSDLNRIMNAMNRLNGNRIEGGDLGFQFPLSLTIA